MKPRVAVIGAGWTGLAYATCVRPLCDEVVVYEAAPRAGGRISTLREDGYLVEAGPHALMIGDAMGGASEDLAREARVELVPAPKRAPRFVVHEGRPVALPAAPPQLLRSPLLGPMAKLRLLAEPLVRPGHPDQTVSAFARRRLGKAALPLVDAFVTGVYAGDPERLVLRHAFPTMAIWDRAGGLLRNLRAAKGPRRFLAAPRDGMQSLTDALAARLHVRLRTPVVSVRDLGHRVLVETAEDRDEYDHVVLAMEPEAVARILSVKAPTPPRAPVAIAAFGLPRERAPAEGYGVLAPEREGRFVLGALYESALFPGRAPEGHALLRCMVGGRRHPERAALPHDELARRAWNDLEDMGLVSGAPSYVKVVAGASIPQPEADHDRWLDALPREGRVEVLGIGHRAVGLAMLAADARERAHALPRPPAPPIP